MQGKSILDFLWMFRGRIKGKEQEGSRWSEKGNVWENRGIRLCWLICLSDMPCTCLAQSIPIFLINSFKTFSQWRSLYFGCMGLSVTAFSQAVGWRACVPEWQWLERQEWVNLSVSNWNGSSRHRGPPATGVSERLGARSWAGTTGTMCLVPAAGETQVSDKCRPLEWTRCQKPLSQ